MGPVFIEKKSILVLLMIVVSTFSQTYTRAGNVFFNGPVNLGTPSPEEEAIQAAREFSEIQTYEDLILRVGNLSTDTDDPVIGSRTNTEERSNAVIPKPAVCVPENQTVCLKNASRFFVFPECTRVPRCGGCCSDARLSCQPTTTVTKNFQIMLFERTNRQMKLVGREIVPVEEHTACTCGCKTKAEHCNDRQIYKPTECRCVCTNIDERTKCLENRYTKEWNSMTCSCKCQGRTECTSGSYYDHNTCSCKSVTTASRRRYPTDGKGSNSPSYRFDGSDNSDSGYSAGQSPIIFTINSDDPRRKHKEDPE